MASRKRPSEVVAFVGTGDTLGAGVAARPATARLLRATLVSLKQPILAENSSFVSAFQYVPVDDIHINHSSSNNMPVAASAGADQ